MTRQMIEADWSQLYLNWCGVDRQWCLMANWYDSWLVVDGWIDELVIRSIGLLLRNRQDISLIIATNKNIEKIHLSSPSLPVQFWYNTTCNIPQNKLTPRFNRSRTKAPAGCEYLSASGKWSSTWSDYAYPISTKPSFDKAVFRTFGLSRSACTTERTLELQII